MDDLQSEAKMSDVSKYNLRCNRNVSEKMTKKDFIYDIRPPTQTVKKIEVHKRPTILPIHLCREQKSDTSAPRYTVISRDDSGGSGDAVLFSNQRTLNFSCNFCHEPIATLFSLSTHVKVHRRLYCKICYWILHENETMDQHMDTRHRIKSNARLSFLR